MAKGNGHVIPDTTIAVDMWDRKSYPYINLFFLTHFHSDHIVGLNNTWNNPIYTSAVTKDLLVKQLGVAERLVHSLDLNVEHYIPMDRDSNEMFTVTLFDANHCPGAVMFLFRGYFGNILYTGDFRYSKNMKTILPLPEIDVLYLDNTYCSSKCIFPKKENAIENILQTAHICLQRSKHLYLGVDNLGKEDLLEKLAKESYSKVYASGKKKNILEILGYSYLLTDHKEEAKIIAVPTNQVTSRNLENWNLDMPSSAIMPTARYCGFNFKPFSQSPYIHVIPLSNHSSFSELNEFVKMVTPKVIIPIVSKTAKGIFGTDISERANMTVFQPFLNNRPRNEFTIPRIVAEMIEYAVYDEPNNDSGLNSVRTVARIAQNRGVQFDDSSEINLDSQLNRNTTQDFEVVQLTANRPPRIWVLHETS